MRLVVTTTTFAALSALVLSMAGCGSSGKQAAPALEIVSALPRTGSWRATTDPIVAAIRSTVRAHGGRAGRYRVRYVDSDDSANLADGYGETYASCEASADRYARHANVVAVIGPLICAAQMIPRLDRASLGLFGFTGMQPGLTHPFPARISTGSCIECRTERFYPGGRRNYLTTTATVDSESRAAAMLLAGRGVRRVAVVSEQGDHLQTPWLLESFRKEARKRGLRIVASLTYRSGPTAYPSLAQHVVDSRADAVYLLGWSGDANPIGASYDDEARLIGSLRRAGFRGAAVGLRELVDGRFPADAGAAGEGMEFLSTLPPGKGDRSAYGRAAYAASAAEAALRAIAASDGTRAGVRRQMLHVTVKGPVGRLRFDRNGDVVPQRIAVFRVHDRRFVYERTVSLP